MNDLDHTEFRIYNAIADFNSVACWKVLQFAQNRQYLAEHLAKELIAASEPLRVSRFDTAIEAAPEEAPVLTIGAIAEDGRPVALLLDAETRRKVGGWLVSADDEQAYDGELAMLRTLVRVLRFAARHDDLAALKQAITNHTTDDAAARAEKSSPRADATPDDARQADLLTAIRANGGRWKSGRAVKWLRTLGYHPISPRTAANDLYYLAEAGHLVRHEEKGVRWYSLARGEASRG